MTTFRRSILTLSVLSLPLLAGCGLFGKQVSMELTDEDKQRCPAVGIVAYTGESTRFVDGGGRTTADVVSRGSISGLKVDCFNTETGVDATVSFDLNASTGPASRRGSVELEYFVVLSNDDKPLERKLYTVSVPMLNGHGSVRQYVGIQMPFADDGVKLVDKEVLLGFQLSREELTYNIHR